MYLKNGEQYHQVLVNSDGDPSYALREVLAPEIRVKRVTYHGIGQCEDMNRPEIPKVSTEEPKINRPPIPRNQVDIINATVGQLLVFKVPEVCVLYLINIKILLEYVMFIIFLIFAGYIL